MINAWWLCLIIPASVWFGMMIAAFLVASRDDR